MNASGFLRRDQRLGNERLGAAAATSAPFPDAPKPDVEVVVAGHDTGVRDVRVVVKAQRVMQIGRL